MLSAGKANVFVVAASMRWTVMPTRSSATSAPRFGIGEWYGKSFVRLPRAEQQRIARVSLNHTRQTALPCPFKNPDGSEACTKKGGVCSLRLYERSQGGSVSAVQGEIGDLRTLCPHRFKQDDIIYKAIGERVLGTSAPRVVSEIRFLQRYHEESVESVPEEQQENDRADSTSREDVGNIDNVLVHPNADPLKWCALEIQAVYFSGSGMTSLFRSILDFQDSGLPFPDVVRRPDYRSSAPKRLMPQLQIKVPTLRRWGKKMAVVVDAAFYRSLGRMETVRDLSNCDIAWFVARYEEDGDAVRLVVGEPKKQTLERAVEGLTGGLPVTLGEFEAKIIEKLQD